MTLEFENELSEIRTFTAKTHPQAFGLKPVKTGDPARSFCSQTATDPEFVSDSEVPLNAYSRAFFACWLIGLLMTTVAHFVHFF